MQLKKAGIFCPAATSYTKCNTAERIKNFVLFFYECAVAVLQEMCAKLSHSSNYWKVLFCNTGVPKQIKQEQQFDHVIDLMESVELFYFSALSVQDGLAADFRAMTKTLYDLNKGSNIVRGGPLKELVIENFDEEQIWQQLELQNNAVLDFFKKSIARDAKNEDLCLLSDQEEDGSDAETSSDKELEDNIMEVEAEQMNVYTKDKDKTKAKKKQSKLRESIKQKYSDEDSDIDFDIEALEQQAKTAKETTLRKKGRKSVVDDKFFKLAEMEAFLEHAEKEDKEEDEEEEDINYFEDIISDDDEEDSEEAKVKVRISVK